MNIRKPVENPLGEPPKRPTNTIPEANTAAQGDSTEQPKPFVPFPTSGVMKPSTVPSSLPPLPSLPSNPSVPPFGNGLPAQPDAVPEVPYVENVDYGTGEEEWKDSNTETEVYLSEEEELKLRKLALSVDDTSVVQTLYALATDEDWRVRDAVASNPNTPESILLALSKDENDFVRQSVMENPSISDNLLASFADDESLDILVEFIDFERTTADMLKPLFNHYDDEIILYLKNSDKLTVAEKFNLRNI